MTQRSRGHRLAMAITLGLGLLVATCNRSESRTEYAIGERFSVWHWDCTVLDAEDLGKKLSRKSDDGTVHSRSTSEAEYHFERLHVTCTAARFAAAIRLAPTVLTLDARNPTLTYAHVRMIDGDDYLDPDVFPAFGAKADSVQPGGTREYWEITEAPDNNRAVGFGISPTPDPEYRSVLVRLAK